MTSTVALFGPSTPFHELPSTGCTVYDHSPSPTVVSTQLVPLTGVAQVPPAA
jgi:hypothetical protein